MSARMQLDQSRERGRRSGRTGQAPNVAPRSDLALDRPCLAHQSMPLRVGTFYLAVPVRLAVGACPDGIACVMAAPLPQMPVPSNKQLPRNQRGTDSADKYQPNYIHPEDY